MNNYNARNNLDVLTVMNHLVEDLLPRNRDDYEFLILNHILLVAMNQVQTIDCKGKKDVLKQIRNRVHEKILQLHKCESFRQETRNRKNIMTHIILAYLQYLQ